MKKLLIFLISILILPISVNAEEVDLAPNAKSAVLIEASTGEIIYQKNIHEKFPPASMTKMMDTSRLLKATRCENKS